MWLGRRMTAEVKHSPLEKTFCKLPETSGGVMILQVGNSAVPSLGLDKTS